MVTRTKKIFVGGLSANTVVEDVKQYFEQFGKVRSSPGSTRHTLNSFHFFFKKSLEYTPWAIVQVNASNATLFSWYLSKLCIFTPNTDFNKCVDVYINK